MTPPYDPRAVANLLLDLADQDGLAISNLALQKLLYFAHAHFLIRHDKPLVTGGFEAWTYGPVHPAVYQAFKADADRPLRSRATARNVMTGESRPLPRIEDRDAQRLIREVLASYGHLPAGRLIDLSHAPNGPWAAVVKQARESVALGLRIPDNVTRERFRYLKVPVGPETRAGNPHEDTPFV